MQKIGESPGSWRARHNRIPPELAKSLYEECRELAKKDPSPVSIARRLSASHSLSFSPSTIRHWIVGDRKLQRRNVFAQRPSSALSYIIGANIGDGCTLTKNWIVKLEVTDLDFAQAFNAKMATLFDRAGPNKILVKRFKVERLPLFVVRYSSRQLVNLLRLPLRKLLEIAFAYPREFLQGFFDAEGHVDIAAGSEFRLHVGAENSDRLLLLRVKLLLKEVFGINSRINRKRKAGSVKVIRDQTFIMRRTSYSLVIRRLDDIKSFADQVGFCISRKTDKLKDALRIIASSKPRERCTTWEQCYIKKGGEWVKY